MSPRDDFQIVTFDPKTHLGLITELTEMLHESYKPLAEAGMSFWAATQPEEQTLHRLNGGDSFFGFYNGRLIATITVVDSNPEDLCEKYREPGVRHFTQLCVSHEFKGRGFGDRLLNYAEVFAKNHGARELALDTSERAKHLIETYQKRGYRFIQKTKWPHTNYDSVVMSKGLNNAAS